MLNILEVLELIHEFDVCDEHPSLKSRFIKGEYEGLGTLFIENKGKVSLRITLCISLGGTHLTVHQWIDGECKEMTCLNKDFTKKALLDALNPIFEDHVYL